MEQLLVYISAELKLRLIQTAHNLGVTIQELVQLLLTDGFAQAEGDPHVAPLRSKLDAVVALDQRRVSRRKRTAMAGW